MGYDVYLTDTNVKPCMFSKGQLDTCYPALQDFSSVLVNVSGRVPDDGPYCYPQLPIHNLELFPEGKKEIFDIIWNISQERY